MSDLERELRAVLDDRAARVDSDLTGPELRRRAAVRTAERTSGVSRLRRVAPVLASAAAVAAVGIGAALLTRPQGTPPPPVEPGGSRPATSSPVTPPAPATPSISARPALPQPSMSIGLILRPTATVPSGSRDFSVQSQLIGVPRSSEPRTRETARTSDPRSGGTSAPRS